MELITLHSDIAKRHPEVREQCAAILNQEWSRSENLRFRSLDSSNPDFPICLALITWNQTKDFVHVMGHSRLTRIPSDPEAVWIESVIVHPALRGQKVGKYLMLVTEKYCKDVHHFKTAYLCTVDQQIFYSAIGYTFCDPIVAYGGNVKLPEAISRCLPASKTCSTPSPTPPQASCQAPPPPPPPPPPMKSEADSDNRDIADTCAKVFKRISLDDIQEPVLKSVPTAIPSNSGDSSKSCCRATAKKDFMKKLL